MKKNGLQIRTRRERGLLRIFLALVSIGAVFGFAVIQQSPNAYAVLPAPGGVEGAALWLKADGDLVVNGSNQVEQWNDQSGSGFIATEAQASSPTHTDTITPTNSIVKVANGINFNPAVDFTGATGKTLKGSSVSAWSSANLQIFSVASAEAAPAGNLSGIFAINGTWTSGGGASGGGLGYLGSTKSYYLDGSGCSVATASATDRPQIARGVYVSATTALGGSTWLDGVQKATGTSCGKGSTYDFFEIGGRTTGTFDSRVFNGKIPEVIVYTSALTAAEAQKIDSYLAIKYGVTLDPSGNLNYLASDGTTSAWNAAANIGYYNNVTGIGRDDNSALNQKQSRSVNPQGIVTVGNGTIAADNISNPNNFADDKDFLMFGDDNNPANTWVDTGVTNTPLTNFKRIPRTWKTQDTGTVGNVTLALDTADADADVPNAISGYYLLRDSNNNGSFADETPIAMSDAGGGQFSVGGINLANGELFTFATLSNAYNVQIQVADNITNESGKTGLFKVRLGARPSAPVTVTLSSSNTNEGTVQSSITIQPDDWDNFEANQVVVTGVNDGVPTNDGSTQYFINTDDVTSADPNFNALTGADVDNVLMYNLDNDAPGISAYSFGGNVTTESGGCATIRFELLSMPSAPVTIPLSLSDTTEGTLNGVAQITIQPANWNQPQNNVVTVCGLADGVVDGNVLYYLVTGDPTSADFSYDAITADQVADVALVNMNVDTDGDGDGVDDDIEDAAPNSGDANEDGIADSTQAYVTSFVSDVTAEYATLELNSACQVQNVRVNVESSQTVVDTGYDYPVGLMSFRADCGTPGYTANVAMYFFGANGSLTLRKHNPNTSAYFNIDGATVQTITAGGTAGMKVSFDVTDGSNLDIDGAANGIINDPAGLALQLPSTSNNSGDLSNTGQNVWPYALLAGITVLVSLGLVFGNRIANKRSYL